jgi:16S rRNA (guanine966-N2)-methyltransferase
MTRNNQRPPRRGPGARERIRPESEGQGAARSSPAHGEVRIVGGAWRGRRIRFPAPAGLRPTPDRVRETLFNWLQFELAGRNCLDLFAGSGALGLEALSRGAGAVTFVEAEAGAARSIAEALHTFGAAARGQVHRADAFTFLASGPPTRYDVVFLDPPYANAWLPRACEALERGAWLAPGAWIYLEDAAARGAPALPVGWDLLRSKKAGDVGYHLARRTASG